MEDGNKLPEWDVGVRDVTSGSNRAVGNDAESASYPRMLLQNIEFASQGMECRVYKVFQPLDCL
jgi:hypothetical protein